MTNRRRFLVGLMASSLAPQASWADAGAPDFLSAGRDASGQFMIAGLTRDGILRFRHPLPARGHAATAHPNRPEAVAFARRPGQFADVIDCRNGAHLTRLTPPAGHHFYGHGVFSPDGAVLYTTENQYDGAPDDAIRGMIGLWDGQSYDRIGAFPSGGIGPHEMLWRQDAPGLVVANGGIETHPDSGRAKLNLATMQPNLTYLSPTGDISEQITLSEDLHQNSIRHLSTDTTGRVGFAMQWQGDLGADAPLVGLHRPGRQPQLLAEDDPRLRNLNGYGGSIAFSRDGQRLAVTSPRGGVVQVLDTQTGQIETEHRLADVCGISARGAGFVATTGTGTFAHLRADTAEIISHSDLAWDNHLIALS